MVFFFERDELVFGPNVYYLEPVCMLRNEMHHRGFVKRKNGQQLIVCKTVLVQFVPHGRFVRSFHVSIMCLLRLAIIGFILLSI